jgi:pantothenate kinase
VTNSLAVFQGGDGAGSFLGATASVKNDPVPADGAVLNIGEGYSIQAVAGRNSLFSNWVGGSALGAFTNTNGALLNLSCSQTWY